MARKYAGYRFHDHVVITSGRLKGEVVTVVGETNLNMCHRIIVHRGKGRDRELGIQPSHLRKLNDLV